MQRVSPGSVWHSWFRGVLFIIVFINEASWFAYRHLVMGIPLAENLPLHLCDISVFVMLFALVSGKKYLVEFLYYAGLVGALLAILFPAISETGSIHTIAVIRYFITHIALVGVGCYFTYGRCYYPSKGAIFRSYIAIHCYALLVTLINLLLGTNYFFTLAAPKQLTFIHAYPHGLFVVLISIIFFLCFCVLHIPFSWLAKRQQEDCSIVS